MSAPLKSEERAKRNIDQSVSVDCEFRPSLSSYSHIGSRIKSPCKHAAHHQHIKSAAFSKLLPAEHWAAHGLQQIDESLEHTLDVYQAHRIINDAFVKRLQEIEQKAPNALEAKLGTYKDWVSVLQRLNTVLLNDFDELEKTIEQHLSVHESRSNYACRRDVATLVKFIRQVYHHKNWNLAGLKFETITPAEILGLNENDPRDREVLANLLDEKDTARKSQSDPFRKDLSADSIKALADEVARRHDEIGKLKREICCLEEEIKNAEKKIQLKDTYIRKLKNAAQSANKSDVQEFPCKYCCQREMAPINMENLAAALQKEKENKAKTVSTKTANDKMGELKSLIDSSIWQNKNSFGEINRINDLFMKLELDRVEAYRRVNSIRGELLKILEPLSTDHQELSIQLNDESLFQAIRDRFEYICSVQEDLKQEKDKLIKEKAEIAGELIFLKRYKANNDEALRELSDLLTSMTGEVCSYESIYDSEVTFNPFCEAICHMKAQASEKIGELKAQLQREKEKRAIVEDEISNFKQIENQTPFKNEFNRNHTTTSMDNNTKTPKKSSSTNTPCSENSPSPSNVQK